MPLKVRCEEPIAFPRPSAQAYSASQALTRLLESLGCTQAFGLVGGAIAPLSEALLHSALQVVHCRHEGGAAFAATEAHFASDRPVVVFVTTGPGILNALTGVAAARAEGAKLILLSAVTSVNQRGRGAAQQTDEHSMMMAGVYTAGPLFHYAVRVEDAAQLQQVAARLATGLCRAGGFIAHLSIPTAVQTQAADPAHILPEVSVALSSPSPAALATCLNRLGDQPFALWLGHGARRAAPWVRQLVERTACGVIASCHAKGLLPEGHPAYVGVSGLGGHDSVEAFMATCRPRTTLVLGSRLAEATSYWSRDLVPADGFIHVDLDPEVFAAAYPEVPTFGIRADIGLFLQAFLDILPSVPARRPAFIALRPPPLLLPTAQGPVRPQYLMQCIQRHCIDTSAAVVMAESGNSFAWCNHLLRFDAPLRYRISPHFGSMGHFVAGVVGAALGRQGKAVAVVGDGAMLMNCELSTAVQYGAAAVWLVLNDAQYGMVEQGMRALGYTPVETALPQHDFALWAESHGAQGISVQQEMELDEAIQRAMAAPGPVVVDVRIDRTQASPLLKRIESLIAQGAQAAPKN